MFVVDTDVISRTSPLSREGDRVSGWLARNGDIVFISAATVAELHFGLARLRLRGAARQANAIATWIEGALTTYGRNVVPLDAEVGRRAGELLARAEKAGFDPGFADACIAASADVRGFEVVTFNARHFAAFRVPHRRPTMDALR